VEGVRHDGLGGRWQNSELGLGGLTNRVARTSFNPSVTLPSVIVDSLLQFSGVAYRLCAREPFDGTRAGLLLTDEGTESAEQAALRKHAIKWGMLRYLRTARKWARAYGGGAIVLMIDDGLEPREPLDRTKIRRIRGARVLNRWELSPCELDMDRRSLRVGLPTVYQVTLGGVAVEYVHHTRVIIMQGFELPAQVMVRQLGWGGSVFDLAWATLRNWQVSMDLVPEMVTRMTQGVYKQKYLEQGASADLKSQIVQRFEAMQAGMGVMGDIAISPEEDYSILQRPSAGMKELGELLVQAFIADGDMPRTIALGESPGGWHGSNSPEVTAWYDYVSAVQEDEYTPAVDAMLELHALAHEGPTRGVVPQFTTTWNPLYQPTQAEKDASDLSKAQRRAADVGGAVITPDEARTDPDLKERYTLEVRSPATPGIEPDGATPDASASASVQDLALNGAQIASLLDIVRAVNMRELTYEQGIGALGVSFPSLRGREATVLGTPAAGPAAAAPGGPAAVPTVATDELPGGVVPNDRVRVQKAAELYGLKTRSITRLIERGVVGSWGFGANRVVSLSEVDAATKVHSAELEAEDPNDPHDQDPPAETWNPER
jgi:phage-related protein (TIGR01555 family)